MSAAAVNFQKLNPNSSLPLYHQLADDLRRLIEQGMWQPHKMIPSESELIRLYDVSRAVVRQALGELDRAGLIYRVQGKGGFVSERKLMAYLMQDPRGFTADMASQGHVLENRVLKHGFIPAPQKVADALGVSEGATVLEIERLRSVKGETLFLGTIYLPEEMGKVIVQENLLDGSINAALAQYMRIEPVRGLRMIEAVSASSREAELLHVKVGAPLFYLFAITYAQTGEPFECSSVWLRGDRLAFQVEVGGLNFTGKNKG